MFSLDLRIKVSKSGILGRVLLFLPYKTRGKSGQSHGAPSSPLWAALVHLSAVEKMVWCDGGGVRDQVAHRQVLLSSLRYLMDRA